VRESRKLINWNPLGASKEVTEYLWYNGPTSGGTEEEFKRERGGRRVKDEKEERSERGLLRRQTRNAAIYP